MILRLALRNCVRNLRRTALVAAAISLSLALLIVFIGMSDGAHQDMAEIGVSMGLGDLVVQQRGYTDDPSIDRRITNPARLEAHLSRLPGVRRVVPRLRSDALISAGATSVGVMMSGVDPQVESRVSNIDNPDSMIAGSALTGDLSHGPGELPPIVVGKQLAATLDVAVGDRVTLTLRPAGSKDTIEAVAETQSGAFVVHGIFATGVQEVDAFWVEVSLPDAQQLTRAGDSVTMLAVFLDDIGQTESLAPKIRAAVGDTDVEVLTWMEAAPDLYAVIAIDAGGMYVMMLIVFIVVATGVLNTLLMSVVERTREFGVLLALGATPARIVAIVLGEAIALGSFAMAIGLGLGLAANRYFEDVGIDVAGSMGSVETSGILLPDRLYSSLSPERLTYSVVAVLVLVLVGAIYPALHAATRKPVEVMHHV